MDDIFREDDLLCRMDRYLQEASGARCCRRIEADEMIGNALRHFDAEETRAVLLRGSRATGRNGPDSDVDLVVLTKSEGRTNVIFKDPDGIRYSLVPFGPSAVEGESTESFCRFFYGIKPISDPEGIGKNFAERINADGKRLCAKITPKDPKYEKYMSKLADCMERADEATSAFARARILREFPAFLSAWNGFSHFGYKHAIDCLIRDDRELAMQYAAALHTNAGKREIDGLLERAFRGQCALNVLDTDFSHSEKAFEIDLGDETMYQAYNRYTVFMKTLCRLKPAAMETVDFFLACREKAPGFFERLHGLVSSENELCDRG